MTMGERLLYWSALLSLLSGSSLASRFNPDTVPPLGEPFNTLYNTTELIELHGYQGRRYEAVTDDGYVLGLTRILRSPPGPPVLMVNGMGLGSELWVLHGSGHDLAFVVSDLGYDVWLGGQRGMVGSDRHLNLTTSDPEYWDFSHDESGYYDLPAMIDLILAETGRTQLFYVGTSLGGTFFMVMCSERPEYCDLVAGNVQFAPAIWIPNWSQLSLATNLNVNLLSGGMVLTNFLSVYNLWMRPQLYTELMLKFCGSAIGEDICFLSLHFVTGFNKDNMAPGWLGPTLSLCASGSSTKQIKHLVQLVDSGGANKFDYGSTKNWQKYQSLTPPSYKLSRISSPTVVYYAIDDKLLFYKAMEKGISQIGNLKFAKPVLQPTFGHAEFVFGKDLYKMFYSEIVDFFDSISGLNATFPM